MKPNEPGLREWEAFVAIAESGGISVAARRTTGSKATVSGALARLEEQLGARLFQRSARGLSLTEAGHAALPHAQEALRAAREAVEAARSGLAQPRGVLRINAPMSFGLLVVVPAVAAFAVQYPDVQVDLVLDDRVLDLVEGGFDLALRIGNPPDSALVGRRLAAVPVVVVASPTYLARVGRPEIPADLADLDALVYSLSSTPTRWTFTYEGHPAEVQVTPRHQATSSLALRHLALQGLGVGRFPRFVVADDLEAGRLEQVAPRWDSPGQSLFAMTTARRAPRKTEAFLEVLRACLGEPRPPPG